MRYCLYALALALAACGGSVAPVMVHRADADAAALREGPRSAFPQSSLSYETELHSFGEDGEHVRTIDIHPLYELHAFGGELMGDDRGEWGGELMFRDQHGALHRMLGKNVHGILQMPFGVVVFTGLAHLGLDEGQIYLVSPGANGAPTATPFRSLAGAPSEVTRTVSGEVVFKVDSGRYEKKENAYQAIKDCYRLTKAGDVASLPCSSMVIVD